MGIYIVPSIEEFKGAPHSFVFCFFFNFFKDTLIGSSSFFWEHNRINPMPHSPSYKLHSWKLNFVQTIWDKIEVLLGTSQGTWELDENTLGINKKPKIPTSTPPPPQPKRRKVSPWSHVEPSCWLHEISISRIFSHLLQPVLIPLPKSVSTHYQYIKICIT
jgi:hypothetical protein